MYITSGVWGRDSGSGRMQVWVVKMLGVRKVCSTSEEFDGLGTPERSILGWLEGPVVPSGRSS